MEIKVTQHPLVIGLTALQQRENQSGHSPNPLSLTQDCRCCECEGAPVSGHLLRTEYAANMSLLCGFELPYCAVKSFVGKEAYPGRSVLSGSWIAQMEVSFGWMVRC